MHAETLSADKIISKLLSDAIDYRASAPSGKTRLVDKDAAKRPRLVGGARKSIARLRADELALRRTTAAVLAQPPRPHCSAAERIASLERTVQGQEMFLNLATHLLAQCDAGPAEGGTGNSAACRKEVARLMAEKNWENATCCVPSSPGPMPPSAGGRRASSATPAAPLVQSSYSHASIHHASMCWGVCSCAFA